MEGAAGPTDLVYELIRLHVVVQQELTQPGVVPLTMDQKQVKIKNRKRPSLYSTILRENKKIPMSKSVWVVECLLIRPETDLVCQAT